MPTAQVNGTSLYYEDTGGDGPPVLLCHGVLWSTAMFAAQIAHLRNTYRCVSYDHRGQGRSEPSPHRTVGMETVFEDMVAMIKHLDLAPCHLIGFSMGGFAGLRLAARHPELLSSCVFIDTSADSDPKVRQYRLLNFIVRWFGVRPVADRAMAILFGKTFMSDPARAEDRAYWRRQFVTNNRSVWRAVQGVIERGPIASDELARIKAPTRLLVGEEDIVTEPAASERLRANIPGATLVTVPHAGHMAPLEAPDIINEEIAAFLAEVRG